MNSYFKRQAARPVVVVAVLFMIVAAVYSNSLNSSFHFDDLHQIVGNHRLRNISIIPTFFTSPGAGSGIPEDKGYRPILDSTFALDYLVSGGETWSFHITNAFIHFLNALLLFFIVRAVLSKAGDGKAVWAPLFASLVFAVHPVQTSAVTYISGRSAVLAAFFSFVSILSFIKYSEDGAARKGWLVLSVLSFLLGLLTKEIAVTAMALILLYLYVFPERPIKKAATSVIPFAAVLVFFLSLKKYLQGFFTIPDRPFGTLDYLVSELKAFLVYLRLLVFPINQNADYNIPLSGSLDLKAVISILILCGAVFYLLKARRKNPAAAFFGLWFIIALAPESSFFPILDTTVEYRLYFPLAGLAACLPVLGKYTRLKERTFIPALLLVLALLGALAYTRNFVWANELSLWQDTVKKAPYSSRAHHNYGGALLDNREYLKAYKELNLALKAKPAQDISKVCGDLGLACVGLGRKREAEEDFKKSLSEYRLNSSIYEALGELYYEEGRYKEAAEVCAREVRHIEGNPKAYNNLAASQFALGEYREAAYNFQQAISYGAGGFDIHYNLALSYEKLGDRVRATYEARAAASRAESGEEADDAEALLGRLGKR